MTDVEIPKIGLFFIDLFFNITTVALLVSLIIFYFIGKALSIEIYPEFGD